MTRVLHIITGLGVGGAERQLQLLVRHLPMESEVAVLTNPGVVAASIAAEGTPVHHLGMRGNRDVTVLPRLVELIRRGRFDVVHTHLYRACVFGRTAARLAGTRCTVATEHSLGDTAIEGRRKTQFARLIYQGSELLGQTTIAVSQTVARRLTAWGVPPSRIVVIPNGIDAVAFRFNEERRASVRRWLRIDAGEFVVGGVGRMVPSKRFDVLIDAFSELRHGRLLLVGDGPARRALEERAAARGIASRTLFAGEVGDVSGLLAAMDVLAAPSTEEAFGLAAVEGLAAGLPLLYSVCPALEDLEKCMSVGARRVPSEAGHFREALEQSMARGSARIAPPLAVGYYEIKRVAEEIGALYDRLLTKSPFSIAPSSAGR